MPSKSRWRAGDHCSINSGHKASTKLVDDLLRRQLDHTAVPGATFSTCQLRCSVFRCDSTRQVADKECKHSLLERTLVVVRTAAMMQFLRSVLTIWSPGSSQHCEAQHCHSGSVRKLLTTGRVYFSIDHPRVLVGGVGIVQRFASYSTAMQDAKNATLSIQLANTCIQKPHSKQVRLHPKHSAVVKMCLQDEVEEAESTAGSGRMTQTRSPPVT